MRRLFNIYHDWLFQWGLSAGMGLVKSGYFIPFYEEDLHFFSDDQRHLRNNVKFMNQARLTFAYIAWMVLSAQGILKYGLHSVFYFKRGDNVKKSYNQCDKYCWDNVIMDSILLLFFAGEVGIITISLEFQSLLVKCPDRCIFCVFSLAFQIFFKELIDFNFLCSVILSIHIIILLLNCSHRIPTLK